jgi:hypothetical protein
MEMLFAIDPIEDALLWFEARDQGRRLEPWTAEEMRELKKVANSVPFGPDLYRGMVAERNGWSYRAGAIDCNQVEQYMKQYESLQN